MPPDGVDISPRAFLINRAALWSIAQQFGRQGISYLAFAILALVLTPEDFGLVGVALVWINFGQIFSELGFGAAIIQRETVDEEHLSTTFALNVAVGGLLTLAGAIGADAIARLFDAPASSPVIQLLSVTFFLRSLGLTHSVIAQRDLNFKELAARDVAAATAGGCIGIALALAGFGVYALVWQTVVSTAAASLMQWRLSPWRPRVNHCSTKALRDLWNFSSRIFLFGLFKFLTQNTDKVLVSNLLGQTSLGIYTLASRLVIVPTSGLSGAVGSYLFPKLSSLQAKPDEARAAFVEAMVFTARVLLPFILGAVVIGPALVIQLFGPEWIEAARLLPVMAVIAAATVIMSPTGQVMKAAGKPHWLFWWSVGFTALVTLALAGGAKWGLAGMAGGLAIAHVLGVIVIETVLWNLLRFGAADVAGIVRAPLLASLVASVVAWLVLHRLLQPNWPGVSTAAVAFAVVYLGFLVFVMRSASDRPSRR